MKKITVRYRRLGREKAAGLAWGFYVNKKWTPTGFIEIHPDQSEKDEIDTIVHEVIHTELPDISEESVERTSGAITAILLKLGIGKKK